MSDIKLFRTGPQGVAELKGQSLALERSLQALMERNLETLLGVRFLASEHSTGAKHKGRIDTLGLDENGCPVIIEYKRSTNENVINQGLFYLDWLMDHQAEFKLLVMEKLGKAAADAIEWGGAAPAVHRGRLHALRRARCTPDEPQHRAHPLPPLPRRIPHPGDG